MHVARREDFMRQRIIMLLGAAVLGAIALQPGWAGTFDGVYRGTMDLNTAVENDPRCAKTWVSSFEVKDGHMSPITTDVKPVNPFAIDVGGDGRFNGRASVPGDSEWRTFAGTIAGSSLTGQFYNRFCHYLLNFQRVQ
jgi:hypothetical protein